MILIWPEQTRKKTFLDHFFSRWKFYILHSWFDTGYKVTKGYFIQKFLLLFFMKMFMNLKNWVYKCNKEKSWSNLNEIDNVFSKCARKNASVPRRKKISSLFFKIAFSLFLFPSFSLSLFLSLFCGDIKRDFPFSEHAKPLDDATMKGWRQRGVGNCEKVQDWWMAFGSNFNQMLFKSQLDFSSRNLGFNVAIRTSIWKQQKTRWNFFVLLHDDIWYLWLDLGFKKKIMLFEWMDRNPVQVWIPICSAPSTLPMGINERVNNTRRISPMTFAKKWTKQQNKTSVIYVTAQMTKVLVLRMQLFVLDRKKSVEHDQQKLILFESVVRQISFLFLAGNCLR